MKESDFQKEVIDDLKDALPGCIVLKNDANYIQGIPDLLVLYKKTWGALECKASKNASRQPNQEHYVNRMNEMSFAAFIYPENKEEVLDAIQFTLRSTRSTRFSRSKQVSLDTRQRREARRKVS